MASKKSFQKEIIRIRTDAIHALLKETRPDVSRLERETALLVFDVLAGLEGKALSLKTAGKYFITLDYALDRTVEKRTSIEFQQMLAEADLIDEVGKKYGPNLAELRELATRILSRDKKLVNYSVLSRTFA
jgi:hypothetical protein